MAAPIEVQLNGIDNLLYYYSTSSSSGNSEIVVVFRPGSNPDINQVNVQNKLSQAQPQLPQVVAALEKRFGRKLNASVVVDPELISGAFQQTQQGPAYYSVPDVLAVDRYQIDGQDRALVPRQLAQLFALVEAPQAYRAVRAAGQHGRAGERAAVPGRPDRGRSRRRDPGVRLVRGRRNER